MKRLFVTVRGRVQGVGFRAATVRAAQRLDLAGWVQNRIDGAVDVMAMGDEARLRQFEAFLREGPPYAHVDGIDAFWDEPRADEPALPHPFTIW